MVLNIAIVSYLLIHHFQRMVTMSPDATYDPLTDHGAIFLGGSSWLADCTNHSDCGAPHSYLVCEARLNFIVV